MFILLFILFAVWACLNAPVRCLAMSACPEMGYKTSNKAQHNNIQAQRRWRAKRWKVKKQFCAEIEENVSNRIFKQNHFQNRIPRDLKIALPLRISCRNPREN